MAANLEGLHPQLMRPRVDALLADPEWHSRGLAISSAFRSDAEQAVLFAAAILEHGSERAARRWVAPPGKSRHGPRVEGFGTAIDIRVPHVPPWRGGVKGQFPEPVCSEVNALLARHGLFSPMDWEDWHFEPIENFIDPHPDLPPTEDHVFTTTVHATPAGAIPMFIGFDGQTEFAVPRTKVVSLLPVSQTQVWLEQTLDGSAFVHADPPTEVVVTFL